MTGDQQFAVWMAAISSVSLLGGVAVGAWIFRRHR